MSGLGYLGAKLGAYIKEQIRAKNYRSFITLLGNSKYVSEPPDKCFVAALPVTIYNSFLSTPKTYIVVLTNGVYLDLNPSSDENFLRIAALNQNTIDSFELVQPRLWDKINIMSCDEYVRVRFATESGNVLNMRLFSDLPGEKSLTMDAYETSRIYRFLKEIKENSQIKQLNY